MIPILYSSVTEGVVPSSYGIGALTDTISASVTEQRNGSYEITLTYPANGIHAEEIQPNCIIKAKPNFTDNPQLFRIYKVGKEINGRFEVSGQHISYDLSGKIAISGTADSCSNALLLLHNNYALNWNLTTDIVSSNAFDISVPSSVRSWFGGKQGSLIDLYGGEWHYDNFTCSLKKNRGTDRGTTIRYGKNLTELSQEISLENLVTGVIPYAINPSTNLATTGTRVDTGLSIGVDRDIAIDFSNEVDWEDSTPVATQLTNSATRYVTRNSSSLINMKNSITLNFAQLDDLKERIDLCDTVRIYFEALGITATAKCVSATWDVIAERYTSNTFGEAVSSIADTIATVQDRIKGVPTKTEVDETINRQTELITGNLGGYVVLHDSDLDGKPDEILIMDSPDIGTSSKLWRWNQNGLGYSDTGYSGSFSTAITSDGYIVCDFLKTGVISDLAGNSEINMNNGIAKLYKLQALASFDILSEGDEYIRASFTNGLRDTKLLMSSGSTDSPQVTICASQTLAGYGGMLGLAYTGGGYNCLYMSAEANGGQIYVKDTNNKTLGQFIAGNSSGVIGLYSSSSNTRLLYADCANGSARMWFLDTSDTQKISLTGSTGNITCVSLTQTSSRKEKENIHPIEDSMKILDLQAVSFDFKNKSNGTNKRGFVAEDVAEVLPNLVTPEDEGRPASINYVEMIPYLQDVIKKQEERIKVLEEKITKLGG